MEKKTHFSIWYFLFALFVILLIQDYVMRPHVEKISYSKFRDMVESKRCRLTWTTCVGRLRR